MPKRVRQRGRLHPRREVDVVDRDAPEQRPEHDRAGSSASSTNALAKASLWRRKRRHASAPARGAPARRRAPRRVSGGDARVEPAIEHVRDEVEQDDEAGEHEGHGHDDRRVVGEDRA